MTYYSRAKQEHSNSAHHVATQKFYPLFLPGDVTWQKDITGQIEDLQYAIDAIGWCKIDDHPYSAPYTIQERWRTPGKGYETHGDITITATNLNPPSPSEFYKNHAHLFTYGTFENDDIFGGVITCAIAFWFQPIIHAINTNQIEWYWAPWCRADQQVIAVPVDALRKSPFVVFELPPKTSPVMP
jgi:hypothetical protein